MKRETILEQVRLELEFADENWAPYNSAHEALGVITEEFEEFKDEEKINKMNRVEEKMQGLLQHADYELLSSGTDLRWRNRAAWQRLNMKRQGLLRNDSPRGMWEITTKGREWLRAKMNEGHKNSSS